MATKSNSWIWRGSIIAVVGIFGTLLTWNFTEVAALPKVYPTKTEVNDDNTKQDSVIAKQGSRIDKMQEAIVEGFKETQRIILDLHKK